MKKPTVTATSYQVADGLYLVRHPLLAAASGGKPAAHVAVPTHHIAIIDVSGSMSYDLPQLRQQLKTKLATLLGEHDTISLVWFSGRGEFGTLLEGERVVGVADLGNVHQAIDRWLRPVGLTGFKEPLEELARLVTRLHTKGPGAFNIIFMSDGQDNQWSKAEILAAVDKAAGGIASAACIAYGYYADLPLLTTMAERLGGTVVLAKDFAAYAPTFEGALQRRPTGVPRVDVPVCETVGGFAFALADGDLLTYAVSGGKVSAPADIDAVVYLSPVAIGSVLPARAVSVTPGGGMSGHVDALGMVDAAYAAVSLYAQRMQPKVVKALLRALGDVALIEAYAGAYGKQKTAAFVDTARAAAFGTGRFTAGYDPTRVPRPDAFTVLDVLNLLAKDPDCRFYPDHEAFEYSAITRARVDASDRLSDEDVAAIEAETSKIKADPTAANAAALASVVDAIKAKKGAPLRFVADAASDGYPVSALVFNAERPNVSIRIRRTGTVDLRGRLGSLPASAGGNQDALPVQFPTFVYRTYAIIADGIVNVSKLPVRLSQSAWSVLVRNGLIGRDRSTQVYDPNAIVVLDIAKLPVINERMVETLSAVDLLHSAYKLEKVGAAKKVYDHYLKTLFPKTSDSFVTQYGSAAEAWLREQGITDGSGFSPRSVQAEATDVRTLRQMEVAFAGLSSLPKVDDARAKMDGTVKGKQNAGGLLMEGALRDVDAWCKANSVKLGDVAGGVATVGARAALEAWLRQRSEALDAERTALLFELAKATFIVIVGQAWFKECSDLGDVSSAKDVERKVVGRAQFAINAGSADQAVGTILLREVDEKI